MFGEKIKALRTSRHLTQETVATHFNISAQAISKWENNTAMPDIALLIPLADYFGVTVDYLLRNDESRTIETIISQIDIKIEEVVKHRNNRIITASIRNNSGIKFENIGLKIRFIDSARKVVDYLNYEILDLGSGETKRFEKVWFRAVPYETIEINIENYRIA